MTTLAVDDSPAYRRLLESAVTGLGHDCVAGEDGSRGLEAVREPRRREADSLPLGRRA